MAGVEGDGVVDADPLCRRTFESLPAAAEFDPASGPPLNPLEH